MISSKMADAINEQINKEMYSAYLYMAMSAEATSIGYTGVANWLMVQYHEEMFHAMKFFVYLHDQGATVDLKAITKPDGKAASVKAMFERILEHEKSVTKSIHTLMDMAMAEKDYATQNLLTWYVDEQIEEEKNATEILTNLKLLGDGPQGVFLLNVELGKRKATIPLDFTGIGSGE